MFCAVNWLSSSAKSEEVFGFKFALVGTPVLASTWNGLASKIDYASSFLLRFLRSEMKEDPGFEEGSDEAVSPPLLETSSTTLPPSSSPVLKFWMTELKFVNWSIN